MSSPVPGLAPGKYARIERERRFLLAFRPPGYVHAEITHDPRFTGGRLAVASHEDLISWLAQYGISPDDPDLNQRG